MDMKNLVEKITQDVLQSLKEGEGRNYSPAQSPAGVKSSAGKRALIIMDGEYAAEDLMKLQTRAGDAAILRCAAVRLPESVSMRESFTFDEAERKGFPFSEYSSVFYMAVRPWQLSALAHMMDNHQHVRLILEALSKGVHVCLIDAVPRMGKAWEAKLAACIKDVQSMGIGCEDSGKVQIPQPSAVQNCPGDNAECLGCGLCSTLAPQKVGAVVEAGAERISSAPGSKGIDRELAAMIDHTLLKPDATQDEVIKLCSEARQYVFASVCVNPGHVKLSAECLKGSPVKVCTVIGFPLGATTSVTKALETRDAIANGAGEIDMVINVGALKAGNYDLVERDIKAVVDAAAGTIVKVIIEAALLTDEEKIMACKLSKQAGADFVKTSTGFGPGGATAHDIGLMRQTVGKYMGVKASGGIRDFETAQKMIKAGATRIGASASVAIVKGEKSDSKY